MYARSFGAIAVSVLLLASGCEPGGDRSAACVPATCESFGAQCGAVDDGCAGTLQCGACGGTLTCGGGGTANVCGIPPAEQGGGATRWVLDLGGAGDENVQGTGVRGDGVIVALTMVGRAIVSPPGYPRIPEALGLVWISPEGEIVGSRTYPVAGRLGAGTEHLAVSPLGEAFLAVGCDGSEGCPDLGAGPITADAIVKLSPDGDPMWTVPCEGCGVLAADRSGGVAVVTLPVPIGVLKLGRDGEREWSWTGAADATLPAVAFHPDGSAIIGQALRVYKVAPGGDRVWVSVVSENAVASSREGMGTYRVADVGITDGGTVFAAGTHSAPIVAHGATIPLPEDGGRGVFLAAFSGRDGTLMWIRSAATDPVPAPRTSVTTVKVAAGADGSVALLVGSDGCALRLERWSADGARLWSRSLDAACTSDAALFARGLDVGLHGDVLLGGGFEVPVDFGTGTVAGKGGRDGFVVDLAP